MPSYHVQMYSVLRIKKGNFDIDWQPRKQIRVTHITFMFQAGFSFAKLSGEVTDNAKMCVSSLT